MNFTVMSLRERLDRARRRALADYGPALGTANPPDTRESVPIHTTEVFPTDPRRGIQLEQMMKQAESSSPTAAVSPADELLAQADDLQTGLEALDYLDFIHAQYGGRADADRAHLALHNAPFVRQAEAAVKQRLKVLARLVMRKIRGPTRESDYMEAFQLEDGHRVPPDPTLIRYAETFSSTPARTDQSFSETPAGRRFEGWGDWIRGDRVRSSDDGTPLARKPSPARLEALESSRKVLFP